jgi:hypothetical protein
MFGATAAPPIWESVATSVLDAGQVERRVRAEARAFAFGHVTASGEHLCEFPIRLFTQLSRGSTTDDIAFVGRTQEWSRQ